MEMRLLLKRIAIIFLLSLLLVSCGYNASPGGTIPDTPTPTVDQSQATPTPTIDQATATPTIDQATATPIPTIDQATPTVMPTSTSTSHQEASTWPPKGI